MDHQQTEWLRQVYRKEQAARYKFLDTQITLYKTAGKMLTGKENADLDFVCKKSRSSVPSNPNTIYNVGNMKDPVLIL